MGREQSVQIYLVTIEMQSQNHNGVNSVLVEQSLKPTVFPHIPTLKLLLYVPVFGQFGSQSYVLPNWHKYQYV